MSSKLIGRHVALGDGLLKAVILAGGRGSRLAEETEVRPKPMVNIGGRPILWHIMKIFSSYGVNEFVICLGHKGYIIKEYFANYLLHSSNVTFDMANNQIEMHENQAEPWKVTLIDTGETSQTGGRLLRAKEYLAEEKDFLFTYGDGVADINIESLIAFHHKHGKLATVSAVKPPGRFGTMSLNGDTVTSFREKQVEQGNYINGGFFVLSKKVFDYIEDDTTIWEGKPLNTLTREGNLVAYQHDGYWQPMDTIRERDILEERWQTGSAPWKLW